MLTTAVMAILFWFWDSHLLRKKLEAETAEEDAKMSREERYALADKLERAEKRAPWTVKDEKNRQARLKQPRS